MKQAIIKVSLAPKLLKCDLRRSSKFKNKCATESQNKLNINFSTNDRYTQWNLDYPSVTKSEPWLIFRKIFCLNLYTECQFKYIIILLHKKKKTEKT